MTSCSRRNDGRHRRRAATVAAVALMALIGGCLPMASADVPAPAADTVRLPAPPPDTVWIETTVEPEPPPYPVVVLPEDSVDALEERAVWLEDERAAALMRAGRAESESQSLLRALTAAEREAEVARREAADVFRLDSVLQALDRGNIAYNPPGVLRVGSRAVVRLVLSPGEAPAVLVDGDTAMVRRRADVPVAERMEAVLAGSAFEITPLGSAVQAVSAVTPTEWSWEVVAREAGEAQPLTLTMSLLLEVAGSDSRRRVTAVTDHVVVSVPWNRRVAGFFGQNWQWLWATLLVPGAAWLARRRHTRRQVDPGAPT